MRKISKKKGPVTSKVVSYDGIAFKSGLEKYMYKALKDAGIPAEYEKHTFELLPSFTFLNDCIERQANSKGDFINRGNKKVLNLKYTPDFVGDSFIIETKGRAKETRQRTKDSIRALPMEERLKLKKEAALKRRANKIEERKRKQAMNKY